MVDRISRLSDELLCHILSFLPTEEAGATSVLSKRWRPLWTTVPVLDYDDGIYLRNDKPSSCFERFVYATLLARDAQQPIRKFRLKYGVSVSELRYDNISHARCNTDVNVWVNTAMRRGIENLDIEIHPQNYMISLSFFPVICCRTLVVLKLKGLSVNAFSSVELPSLKSLHLEHVRFVDPNYFMELLYGCPMLEDLKAIWLDYAVDEYDCKGEFKSLSKLVRARLHFVMVDSDVLLNTISNVEFLSIKQSQLVDEVPEFPHLRHLSLRLDNHSWHSVLLMLKNCPKLLRFKLDLRSAVYVLPYPYFVVPECLTSHLKKCYLKYYRGTESELQFAKYIMENSTSLQSMRICCLSANPFEALKDLALCPRKSTSCELSFNLYES